MASLTGIDAFSSDLSVSSLPQSNSLAATGGLSGYVSAQNQADSLVIEKTVTLSSASGGDAANVNVNVDDIYKSLSISAQQIIQKLNELLKGKVPNGVESLKPEDVTPEKTSDTIVNGINAFFDAYAKSNSDLPPEELISRFFAAAKKGVEDGYGDASKTLESLGAFNFDGVQDGISKTKELIDQKLKDLEAQKRKELKLDTAQTTTDVAGAVSAGVLAQAGAGVVAGGQSSSLNIAA